MNVRLALVLTLAMVSTVASAQVPKPFPKPGQPSTTTPPPPQPQPQQPPVSAPAQAAPLPPTDAREPAPGSLGVAIYPAAQYITSYDAGRGQRYFLYGTTAPFADIVQFYRNTLKQRGELVFEEPPVHQFDTGRFREETMAFPPSVTVKDYTWGGSAGYLNPKRGAQPQRYPTIIQIVPVPPGGGK
jgi:hypothetical protein